MPASEFASAVAATLRAERAARRWTYRELADAAGMTEQSVMRYLTGKRDLHMADLGSLADALGISPARIVQQAMERRESQPAAAGPER
ncbi:helix-turn-helix domain-containing protein [Arthrobacter koreensis]|uniref:helix-turn-helix domain-containing protein n=1 Tax=Arthrobacter koreensis TaxID=199136 RepID=UPI0036D7E269